MLDSADPSFLRRILKTTQEMQSECAYKLHVQRKYYFPKHFLKMTLSVS